MRGESNAPGCVCSRHRRRREQGSGGRHRQALGGPEAYYTRELATDHEQYLSGDPGTGPVRLTGTEDVNWLYVQLSRANYDTRLYAVVGPEPTAPGSWTCPTVTSRTGICSWPGPGPGRRADPGHGHPTSPDLQQLSTAELRAERDRLRRQLDQAPATVPAS
jgi:hypothetical protein